MTSKPKPLIVIDLSNYNANNLQAMMEKFCKWKRKENEMALIFTDKHYAPRWREICPSDEASLHTRYPPVPIPEEYKKDVDHLDAFMQQLFHSVHEYLKVKGPNLSFFLLAVERSVGHPRMHVIFSVKDLKDLGITEEKFNCVMYGNKEVGKTAMSNKQSVWCYGKCDRDLRTSTLNASFNSTLVPFFISNFCDMDTISSDEEYGNTGSTMVSPFSPSRGEPSPGLDPSVDREEPSAVPQACSSDDPSQGLVPSVDQEEASAVSQPCSSDDPGQTSQK